MNFPDDLKYTKEHEWCRIQGNRAVVGITDHAQDQLGDIVYVDLPEIGATIEVGSVVGELESTKSVSDVYSPVSGEVIAVNPELEGSEELINSDPYGEGWLFKVRVSDADPTESLLSAEQYTSITVQ